MRIEIPEFCLVAVVAASDVASMFAGRHFAPSEVLGLASQTWPTSAAERLGRRELVALNASGASSQQLMEVLRLAKRFYAQPIALVLPDSAGRPDVKMLRSLEGIGFQSAHPIESDTADAVQIMRVRLPVDRRYERGPFDIIGDIHGCADELEELLDKLGYNVAYEELNGERRIRATGPAGRRVICVGDFTDRGPRSPDVLRIVMGLAEGGLAMAVPGNHDVKFIKWLRGANVRLTHGLDLTVAQFASEDMAFRNAVREFLLGLPSHLWLDGGRLAVAHAGIRESMIGRATDAVREFCLYGDTDGETDETGLVVRYNWAAAYRGSTAVVYGHTPVAAAEWLNNAICVDTGCVFGGRLTALRLPEREIVSVTARRTYAQPGRPFGLPPVRPTERVRPLQHRRPRT